MLFIKFQLLHTIIERFYTKNMKMLFFMLFVLALNLQGVKAQQNCTCTEYLYVNDPTLDITHKFAIAADGAIDFEIFSDAANQVPWLAPNIVTNAHGVVSDLQGNLYISQIDTNPTTLYKISCDGTVLETNTIPNWNRTLNLAMIGTTMYSIGRDVTGDNQYKLYSHDVCDGSQTGEINLPDTDDYAFDPGWGLVVGLDGEVYFTQTFSGTTDDHCIYQVDQGLNTITQVVCIPNINGYGTLGVAQDEFGNFYLNVTNTNGTIVHKIDPNGNVIHTLTDNSLNQSGFAGAWGIIYNEPTNTLYIGTLGDDCVAVFDAGGATGDMTYLAPAGVPHEPGTYSKAMNINTECCIIAPEMVIDTFICGLPVGFQIDLSSLINCDIGPICGANWTAQGDTDGLEIDNCLQSASVVALEGCATFQMANEASPTCPAFTITVNIGIGGVVAAQFTQDQENLCAGENGPTFTATVPADGGDYPIMYQWQRSEESDTTGFVDIFGATGPIYTPPAELADTVYYRQIVGIDGCHSTISPSCADTSAVLTLIVTNCCDLVCDETIIEAPSCVGGVDGTITVVGSGETNIEYSIDGFATPGQATGVFTGLSAGFYTVTLRDVDTPDCTIECTGLLVEPTVPLSCDVVTISTPTCDFPAGGLIEASASGGYGNYTYLWNTGETTQVLQQIIPGNYSVTITDSGGCEVICNVSIPEPVDCQPTLTMEKVSDFDQTAIGNEIAYTISVTNEGPGQADNVYVSDNLPAGLSYISDNGLGAYDPATGQWTIASIPEGGTVSLEIKVLVEAEGVLNNVAVVDSIGGFPPDENLPEATDCVSVPYEVCEDEAYSFELQAPTGLSNYQWYNNGVAIAGATGPTYFATAPGSYTYTTGGAPPTGDCNAELCCPVIIEEITCCAPIKCIQVDIIKLD